jgi:hypothetical protein
VNHGFVVTFGTEHNTPSLEPITLYTTDDKELSATLKRINYEGACITVAHQALVADGKQGWLDAQGQPDVNKYDEFVALGNSIITA